jgi:hypothetical protein
MWRLALLIIVLILVGCAEPEPIRPTPVPSPTPTPSVAPFKSPDGVILADTTCWRSGINTTCIIEFPNGKTIRGSPGYASDWSPDGRYAVACIGATHDSPCGIAEVWDMINGQKIVSFPPFCYNWSPTEPHPIGYLVENSTIDSNEVELYVMDVETMTCVRQATYPDWYKEKWANLTVYTSCLAPLDRIGGSHERGFVGPPFD